MSSWLVHSLLPLVVHVFMFAEDLSLGLRFQQFQIDWFATTGEGEPFPSPSRSHYRLRYVFKSLSLEHFLLQNLKWSFKWTQLARLLIRISARFSYLRLLAFNLHLNLTSLFYQRNMRKKKVMKDPLFCLFMLWSQLLCLAIALTWRCLLFDPLESSPKDLIQDWTASSWFWKWNFLFWGSRKARKTNLRIPLENKFRPCFSKKLLSPRASIR